jgi:DNA invertase Pin-like site-specific DNA recombinase
MSDATVLVPVAQYLRMSTEHQQYSLDSQESAIQTYADAHGFCIVQTYTDGAKSGVVLKHRNGLTRLLQDVMGGHATYKAVLVYDVSRWGRFQDADEGAHYEFLCKTAGIPVHYCAETFINDGKLPNALIKALKRTMAGEYSRELGVKVLVGLKRLASIGFKQGGSPGYGLRRMLVSGGREPKQQLAEGERKSITTDRVILVPGPADEVDCVRDIYRMFVEEKRTVYGIACQLNEKGVNYRGDSQWDYMAVYNVLSHPKYMGCNVFGRTSQKLGARSVRTPKSEWVMTPGAFAPVVSEATFQEAQRILLNRTINKSNEDLLDALRLLLAREGRLSLQVIKRCPEVPSASAYRERFGSLRRAYELIGYGRPNDFGPIDLRRRTQTLRDDLIRAIQSMFPTEITVVRRGGRWRSRLRLKRGLIVSVLVSRSIGIESTPLKWQIDPVVQECRYTTLIALLNVDNSAVQKIYVFPCMDRKRRFHISMDDVWLNSGTQLRFLSEFREVVKTTSQKR